MTDLDPSHKGAYTYEMLWQLFSSIVNNKFYTRGEKIRYTNQVIKEWQNVKSL